MQLQRYLNGRLISLDCASELGAGGEACIYAIAQFPNLAAKVYHRPTESQQRKLEAMIANPPDDPTSSQNHISIAWPIDLLHASDGVGSRRLAGFLMPKVAGMRPIADFYNPKTRRQQCPLFNWLYLHRTARNLAAALQALHDRGYVVGDLNESNILVADTALVTLVDTDSFQVPDLKSKTAYRCPVGKAEFTPPELQGVKFSDVDRKAEHDLFGLAVLIFQLLMEGTHPFAAVYTKEGDPPAIEKRILAGHFPYSGGRRIPYVLTPTAPPLDILHPSLRRLFIRSFKKGHKNHRARAEGREWLKAIIEAEKALTPCSANPQHQYSNHLKSCPWCQRAAQMGGRDPFPSKQAVQNTQHLKPISPSQSPLPPVRNAASAPSAAMVSPKVEPKQTKTSLTHFRLKLGFGSLLAGSLIGFLSSYLIKTGPAWKASFLVSYLIATAFVPWIGYWYGSKVGRLTLAAVPAALIALGLFLPKTFVSYQILSTTIWGLTYFSMAHLFGNISFKSKERGAKMPYLLIAACGIITISTAIAGHYAVKYYPKQVKSIQKFIDQVEANPLRFPM